MLTGKTGEPRSNPGAILRLHGAVARSLTLQVVQNGVQPGMRGHFPRLDCSLHDRLLRLDQLSLVHSYRLARRRHRTLTRCEDGVENHRQPKCAPDKKEHRPTARSIMTTKQTWHQPDKIRPIIRGQIREVGFTLR